MELGTDALVQWFESVEQGHDAPLANEVRWALRHGDADRGERLIGGLWGWPSPAARALAERGDSYAIGPLLSRLATLDLHESRFDAREALIDIVHAIEALGGDAGRLGAQRLAEVRDGHGLRPPGSRRDRSTVRGRLAS